LRGENQIEIRVLEYGHKNAGVREHGHKNAGVHGATII